MGQYVNIVSYMIGLYLDQSHVEVGRSAAQYVRAYSAHQSLLFRLYYFTLLYTHMAFALMYNLMILPILHREQIDDCKSILIC